MLMKNSNRCVLGRVLKRNAVKKINLNEFIRDESLLCFAKPVEILSQKSYQREFLKKNNTLPEMIYEILVEILSFPKKKRKLRSNIVTSNRKRL